MQPTNTTSHTRSYIPCIGKLARATSLALNPVANITVVQNKVRVGVACFLPDVLATTVLKTYETAGLAMKAIPEHHQPSRPCTPPAGFATPFRPDRAAFQPSTALCKHSHSCWSEYTARRAQHVLVVHHPVPASDIVLPASIIDITRSIMQLALQ